VLDVGIGHGEPAAELMIVRNPVVLDGIEWFRPYTKRLEKFYDQLFLGDANKILPLIPGKTYDVVMAFEVIEHQERNVALRMIEELERVGRFVIISSPNYFYDGYEADGNVMQIHRSIIHSWEMRRMGYTVRGLNFARIPAVWAFTRLVPDLNTRWLAWKETS
jgi:SAM-dependent methyltransferase